jgi:hypothetical protein
VRHSRWLLFALLGIAFILPRTSNPQQQPWSGIISTARATSWTQAGLPGDVPPDGSWTQSGSTISAYGSTSSYASPSTIQTALSSCGTDHYVLLGVGDFYLTGGVSVPSNCVLRGSGANQTRIHVNSATSPGCNGYNAIVCIVGSNTYGGYCSIGTYWPCPSSDVVSGWQNSANWTSGYSQGSTQITLSNVTGIVVNLTPIVLDECDTGFTGNSSNSACVTSDGAITAASVYTGGGGSGYNVGDTGTINGSVDFGTYYGLGATYTVTSASGGAVTGFTITNGGGGYTYTSTNPYFGAPTSTTTATGSGSGFEVQITGVTGYDNSNVFACAISMICENESGSNTSRNARSQSEVVIATAISGSGPYTVTLAAPLMHANWSSGQNPQAWWGSSTTTNSGVEDVLLDPSGVSGGASCVTLSSSYKIWVSGIACKAANLFHVFASYTYGFAVLNSYFYQTYSDFDKSYGIGSGGFAGYALFENNIFQGVADPNNTDGTCSGCVFAYNFSVNPDFENGNAALFPITGFHAASTDYILHEGNIGSVALLDAIHGPHFLNTLFRNYYNGYESNDGTLPSQDTIPITIAAFSRYNNVLGNVLGTAGYHKAYQCNPSSSTQTYCNNSTPSVNMIYNIGNSGQDGQIDFNNTPSLPNDMLTISSTYRYGNYDTVNGAVQWNSSEVPTSDPNYPNAVPLSNAFPASFYNGVTVSHPSCGTGLSFWKNPTTGTCPLYPPIGPDVTNGDIGMCTSGTYQWSRALNSSQCAGGSFQAGSSTNGGYGNSNPAMRCYLNQMGGSPDGTGSMLTFNPASCYSADSAGASIQPPPANGLTASPVVVQ